MLVVDVCLGDGKFEVDGMRFGRLEIGDLDIDPYGRGVGGSCVYCVCVYRY